MGFPAGEMMGRAAEETFPGAGCGQAGDPGPPSTGCTARWLCPQMPTSVFRAVNCGSEACFVGQQREQRGAGFYSKTNVLCENNNVTCFIIVFNVCLV